MRTALLLSGKISQVPECYESIIEHMVKPYEADVFVDTWTPENDTVDSVDEVIRLFKPKLVNVEEFNDAPLTKLTRAVLPSEVHSYDGYVTHETHIENLYFMYYKVWRSNQLRKVWEETNRVKYDCVIRMRFQLRFEAFPVIVPERKTVYIPAGGDHRGGICDMISVADSQTMDIYANLYNELYLYKQAGFGLHPESILRKHLEIHRLKVERFPATVYLRGGRWL